MNIIKKRHSFVLFEVLLSLLLITMSILPFSSYPYRIYKKEFSLLKKMTMEPYFTRSFEEAYKKKDNPILEDIPTLFGEKDTLIIKRLATISKRQDDSHKKSLTEVQITLSAGHAKLTRTKYYLDGDK
ncbi:hypothetical protein K0U07_05120 [bacterium]|nr:hypothetical protein [bacterium]